MYTSDSYNNKALPEMNELLELREGNMSAWTWFADKVMECVAGKRVWGEEKTMKLMSKACSIFDEVFALLILYNNWDKWCAEMITPPQKVDTYFTSNLMGCCKFQGWSDEGIAKYNELLE